MKRSLYFLIFLVVVIPQNLVSALDCGPCKTSYDNETQAAVKSYVEGTLINCDSLNGKNKTGFNRCKNDHNHEFGYNGITALRCCHNCANTKYEGFDSLCKEVNKTKKMPIGMSMDMPLTYCVVDQIRYVTERKNRFSSIQKVVDYSGDTMKDCCVKSYNDTMCIAQMYTGATPAETVAPEDLGNK